jgi:hypothetical protein
MQPCKINYDCKKFKGKAPSLLGTCSFVKLLMVVKSCIVIDPRRVLGTCTLSICDICVKHQISVITEMIQYEIS